jgi:hypothetical protein
VDVSRFAGEPTLYTVHLSGGGTLQIYLDPDHPGPAEFHTTFLDASHHQVDVATIRATVTPAHGTPLQLVPRLLEPGHFVSDVTAAAGPSHYDIVAVTRSGETLSASIDITPGG